jgi:cell division protein FtsL
MSESKSQLVEKMLFAAVPIMFSCIVYLLSTLNSLNNKVTILESKISVVVTQENKAIPPQGTTIEMQEIKSDAALARATLDKRLSIIEFKLGLK